VSCPGVFSDDEPILGEELHRIEPGAKLTCLGMLEDCKEFVDGPFFRDIGVGAKLGLSKSLENVRVEEPLSWQFQSESTFVVNAGEVVDMEGGRIRGRTKAMTGQLTLASQQTRYLSTPQT